MPIKPKSQNNLGALLHAEFCAENGIAPKLWDQISQNGDEVTQAIAEQWKIKDYSVSNYFETLIRITSTGIIHRGNAWIFMLRVAQCAALANKRLTVNLAPMPHIAENPHSSAIETISHLGTSACAFLASELSDDFSGQSLLFRSPNMWLGSTKEKVAELCVTPRGFITSMNNFVDLVSPEQKPSLINNGPKGSMQSIYRLSTAAAVLGQELQIEFVPFNQADR